MNTTPDYEGFVTHLREWEAKGIPWGHNDLVELAKKYNTPVPQRKDTGDYVFVEGHAF